MASPYVGPSAPPPTPERPLAEPAERHAMAPLWAHEISALLKDPRAVYYCGLGGPAVVQLRVEVAARLGQPREVVEPWLALNSCLDRLQVFRERHGRDPIAFEGRRRERRLVGLGEAAEALGVEAPRLAEALGLAGAPENSQLEVAETGYDPDRCAACKAPLEGPAARREVAYEGFNAALLNSWRGVEAEGLEALELHPEEAFGALRLVCVACAGGA